MAENHPALDRGEFESMLRGAERGYWDKHRFHQRMDAGELRPDELRAWVANRWYYQRNLPQKDAAIVANCPLPEVRRRWLPRIAYHDGTADGDGGCARWLVLADAVGLSRAEVTDERHVLPGVRFAVDSYVTFARTRPWIEGVASSLTELFAPAAMAARTTALRQHYPWLDHGAFGYFDARINHAREECVDALDIVLSHCTSRHSQAAAVRALEFKTDVLWSMLDAIEHSLQVDR
ncbi:MAG: pyrroloquinoline quinone biosynthesis protein C [Pseudonocardiales bacterium]|nr:pyrroloquinoline-quinone synthase PqqC [Actinomycetota bacterium]PZS21596.1 MAG: pyrroloquinoline quinone biosynthesis protein C [Pseudonocardiales bacterium]